MQGDHGSRAREYRKRLGLTMEQVAVRAGVTTKTIWRLEQSKFKHGPHERILVKIAAVYGCVVDDLRAGVDFHDECK